MTVKRFFFSSTLLTIIAGPALAANPASTCYQEANADHSGLEVKGWLNGQVAQTFTSVGMAMQWTAAKHEESSFDLTANTAGVAAVKQAMQCLWTNEVVSLSAIVVNQISTFQVHTNTLNAVITEGGTAVAVFDFVRKTETCNAEYDAMLEFTEQDGADTVYLGTMDFGFDAVAFDPGDYGYECFPNVGNPCTGECKKRDEDDLPSPPHQSHPCDCDDTGSCTSTGTRGTVGWGGGSILEHISP